MTKIATGTGLLCGVCAAPASNKKYYGGVTCVSCRMFFRRSVHRSYSCVRTSNDCNIDPKLRKFCKKCRFRRCLENGMDPQRVKSDPKGLNANPVSTNDEEIIDLENVSSNVFEDQHKQQNVSSTTIIVVPLSETQISSLSSETNISSLSPLVPVSTNFVPATAMSPSSPENSCGSSSSNIASPSSCLSLPKLLETPNTSPSNSMISSSSLDGLPERMIFEALPEPSIKELLFDTEHEGNYLTFIDENKKTGETERSQKNDNSEVTNIIEISMSKLSLDEEYLLHEIVERKNLLGEYYYNFILEKIPDYYSKFYTEDLEVTDCSMYNDILFKALTQVDNFLLPEAFGKFNKEFFGQLAKYTVDAMNFFDVAIFLSNSRADNMIDQDLTGFATVSDDLEPVTSDSPSHSYMPEFFEMPPKTIKDFSMFKSPWCKTREDEIYFEQNMDELGQIGLQDDKLRCLIGIILLLNQPKDSPFAKLRHIKRLQKTISSLLYRYLNSIIEDPTFVNKLCQNISRLITNLDRCVYIYYNSRLQ